MKAENKKKKQQSQLHVDKPISWDVLLKKLNQEKYL